MAAGSRSPCPKGPNTIFSQVQCNFYHGFRLLGNFYPGMAAASKPEKEMPTILRKDGFRFFFFSREGTEPPHIHVEQAERYAKFWLEPAVLLEESRGFHSSDLLRIYNLIEENREVLG